MIKLIKHGTAVVIIDKAILYRQGISKKNRFFIRDVLGIRTYVLSDGLIVDRDHFKVPRKKK